MNDLSVKDVERLRITISQLLHGVPIGQALEVLDETRIWLLDTHTVDASNPRFKAKCAEFSECLNAPVEEDGPRHQ